MLSFSFCKVLIGLLSSDIKSIHLVFNRFIILNSFAIIAHLQMSVEIKVIATKTYTKSKHFLSVMIFINLWILTFASELPHLFHYSLCVLMCAVKTLHKYMYCWVEKISNNF